MSINREFFFDFSRVQLFGGSLTQKQVEGMTAILDYWEANHAAQDKRWLAYMLGTAFHETDRKMQPIKEYGSTSYFDKRYGPPPVGKNPGLTKTLGNTQQGDGSRYCGRGFVQLTGRRNYTDWKQRLNVDLLNNPDLLLTLAPSIRILFEGSIKGTFTGRRLDQYFNPTTADWKNARRIINRLDKAELIAGYAKNFYAAISTV